MVLPSLVRRGGALTTPPRHPHDKSARWLWKTKENSISMAEKGLTFLQEIASNELAGASAEKGPLSFSRFCLRWWSADHSSHIWTPPPPSPVVLSNVGLSLIPMSIIRFNYQFHVLKHVTLSHARLCLVLLIVLSDNALALSCA